MLSSLWFLDARGKPIIGRNYRGDIPANTIDSFLSVKNKASGCVAYGNKLFYHYLSQEDVFLVGISRHDHNSAVTMSFLMKALAVFEYFIGSVGEESLRENFVLVYELFDELCDFGIPQCTDVRVLKDLVTQQGVRMNPTVSAKSPPMGATSGVSWRKPGIKYKRNEVFLDVIESVDVQLDSKAQMLTCSIRGDMQVKSRLSGMPELKLGMNDRLMMEASRTVTDVLGTNNNASTQTVEMEDFQFHPCVRLDRFQSERSIVFIPPDGDFTLLSYRINNAMTFTEGQLKPLFQVQCTVERNTTSSLELRIRISSQFKRKSNANRVRVEIPVPSDTHAPKCSATIGAAAYRPERNAVVWSIGYYPGGGKEHQLNIKMSFPTVRPGTNSINECMRLSFEVPYFIMSGVQVRYLKVVESSGYASLPWVRYITQNGGISLMLIICRLLHSHAFHVIGWEEIDKEFLYFLKWLNESMGIDCRIPL